ALGDYFDGKPVLLSLVYFGCPMLCGQSLSGLAASLKALSFAPGKEFTVLVVSFDPRDTPAVASGRKAAVLARYGRLDTAAGWHFLTGEQAAIDRLTPAGTISRYFYGIEPAPRDLRLGLVEASANKIGSAVDQLLLFCFHYDPATGRYGALVMGAVRAGGALTLLALGMFLALAWRREARRP